MHSVFFIFSVLTAAAPEGIALSVVKTQLAQLALYSVCRKKLRLSKPYQNKLVRKSATMSLCKVGNQTSSQDPQAVNSRIFVGNLNTFQVTKTDVEKVRYFYLKCILVQLSLSLLSCYVY